MPDVVAVESGDSKTYQFTCGAPRCGFVSSGHETKKSATARKRGHLEEHKTGEPASEIGAHMLGMDQEEFEDHVAQVQRENAAWDPVDDDYAEVDDDADRS